MSIKRKARNWAAKWMMRVKQASSVLRLGWWMVTGISATILAWDFLTTLQTILLISTLVGGTFLFAYGYDKTRTMKEQARRRTWRKGNFLGPKFEMFLRFQRFLMLSQSRFLGDKEFTYEEYENFVEEKGEELIKKWRKSGV